MTLYRAAFPLFVLPLFRVVLPLYGDEAPLFRVVLLFFAVVLPLFPVALPLFVSPLFCVVLPLFLVPYRKNGVILEAGLGLGGPGGWLPMTMSEFDVTPGFFRSDGDNAH